MVAAHFDREASSRFASLRGLQAGPHSGSWVSTLPGGPADTPGFSAPEWQALCRFRCGVPFCSGSRCGGCGASLDAFGDHASGCAACGLYARHNRARGALADEARLAGATVAPGEQSPQGSSKRPADLLISFPDDPIPDACDVSVGHPLQLSSHLAAVSPGALAERMEKAKVLENGPLCASAGWRCTPVCVETTGVWGPSAQKLVRRIVKLQSMRLGQPTSEVANHVWRRLNAAVAKGTAIMLTRAYTGTFDVGRPPVGTLGRASSQQPLASPPEPQPPGPAPPPNLGPAASDLLLARHLCT